jgi:hypothetical protein
MLMYVLCLAHMGRGPIVAVRCYVMVPAVCNMSRICGDYMLILLLGRVVSGVDLMLSRWAAEGNKACMCRVVVGRVHYSAASPTTVATERAT